MEDPPDSSKLMLRLREERSRQGLTVEWVAGRAGVTKQAISDFETDTTGRKRPAEATLRNWLRALQLPDGWADAWVEYRIEEEVARALGSRRGPRAMPAEDIDAIRRIIRRAWGRGS